MDYTSEPFNGFTVRATSMRTVKGAFATASLQSAAVAQHAGRLGPITMGPFLTEYVAMAVVIDRMRSVVEAAVGLDDAR